MKNPLVRPCLAAALVAGFSVVGIAGAQAPTPSGGAGPSMAQPAPPMGGHAMRGRHMMMELDRLKNSLRLNASQAALWDRAAAQMQPPANGREQMRARRDRLAAMLDDPNFDPRRMAAEMDGVRNERQARMTAIRDAWFAVYDSLNPVQRGQVREFLRSRMGRRMGGHGGPMEDRGGMPGRDGGRGAMPPPR